MSFASPLRPTLTRGRPGRYYCITSKWHAEEPEPSVQRPRHSRSRTRIAGTFEKSGWTVLVSRCVHCGFARARARCQAASRSEPLWRGGDWILLERYGHARARPCIAQLSLIESWVLSNHMIVVHGLDAPSLSLPEVVSRVEVRTRCHLPAGTVVSALARPAGDACGRGVEHDRQAPRQALARNRSAASSVERQRQLSGISSVAAPAPPHQPCALSGGVVRHAGTHVVDTCQLATRRC